MELSTYETKPGQKLEEVIEAMIQMADHPPGSNVYGNFEGMAIVVPFYAREISGMKEFLVRRYRREINLTKGD